MDHPSRSYQCVHALFETQALAAPDAAALLYQGTALNYGELNRRANQVAHYLRQCGVGRGALVGICAERSPALVIGILGILKAGGVYVPLDPNYPKERLQFMLNDSQVAVLLTDREIGDWRLEIAPPRQSLISNLQSPPVIDLIADWEQITRMPEQNPACDATAEDLAYVTYTSGSTGRPKGAAIPHRSILGFIFDVDYVNFDSQQTFLHYSSISWDALTLELWPALLCGGRCVLYPAQLPTPRDLGLAVQAHGISILWLTASLFNAIIDSVPETLAGVRQLLVGGEALSAPHVQRALELLPNTQIVNGYGPSECTVFTCCYPIPRSIEPMRAPIPIGYPIGDRKVYLLDQAMNRTPIGIPGEIYVGGPAVAHGYLNRPDLTAERFVPSPWSVVSGQLQRTTDNGPLTTDNRLYKTGDLARYRPDGAIEFLGRVDHQVKIRGFRIEPEEIDAVLMQHPAVQAGVVQAREDRPGEKRLVAYIVPSQEQRTKDKEQKSEEADSQFSILNSQFSIQELRQFLRDRLPDYMVPSAFVLLDALPLTPNGKVDRQVLPVPGTERPALDQAFVGPRTPTEELLAAIWADVLGLDRVGIHDNFFELGGQSLLGARLTARVRETFQIELPIRALFERPDVAELAEHITRLRQEAPARVMPPIERADRAGPLPLSFAQQRLWFLDRLEPGSPLYNVPGAVRLRGPLDAERLQQGLNQVARRHEILRTTFGDHDGRPYQIIAPGIEIPLGQVDLSASAPDEQAEAVERLAVSEAHVPFDLARGPLLRATLLRLADQEHVLLLTMHHIISDGWSIGVLIQELSALYGADTDGRDALAPLPVQYADYAAWQRRWMQGEAQETQLGYWRQRLAGAPATLDLPTDQPRPAAQTYRGASVLFTLPAALSRRLAELSRREGTTLFMTLLAVFKVLLRWYSGQDDLVVGSPIAGRGRVELEGLIGFFVNTLVLRTDLAGDPTFQELLGRVREVTLGAYAHQDLPFEQLVEALHPDRSTQRLPLFQVWFVLQNTPAPAVEVPGLALEPLDIDYGMARYDIRLGLADGSNGLSGSFEYNADMFDATTIMEMADLFAALLAAVAARPQLRLNELDALLAEARQQRQLDRQQALKDASRQKLMHARRQAVRGT